MNLNEAKALTILPAQPSGIGAMEIQFYVGCEELKLKAVDKATGASFTAAYLCPVFKGDPIKRAIALDFAAMACAAPRLVVAAEAMMELAKVAGDGPFEVSGAAIRTLFEEALAQAKREVPTFGILSPEVEAVIKSHLG